MVNRKIEKSKCSSEKDELAGRRTYLGDEQEEDVWSTERGIGARRIRNGTSFLYYLKPLPPSASGYAAASARGRGLSAPK